MQETILDKLNRPALQVLPVPTDDGTLHYFPDFNRNGSHDAYSFADFNVDISCTSAADPMSIDYGSSKFYSQSNPFPAISGILYDNANDIPDAGGFPFSVTDFTNDMTGRVRRQGGVGPNFQIGSGHETSYFYSPSSLKY